jgi:molecular chaperone DnaK
MAMLHCPALGVDLLPEEISAEVLKKIIKDVEEALGEPVTKAVVTVPAYFNDAQRDATSDAGYAAGLKKVKLLREPQAAALAYGVNRQEDSTVMVFGALTTRRPLKSDAAPGGAR